VKQLTVACRTVFKYLVAGTKWTVLLLPLHRDFI